MAVDLSKYSTKELNTLSKDIDKELRARRKHDEKKAREEMKKVAERYGLSLSEVAGSAATTKNKGRTQASAKYVHPDDGSKTWSGRGRKPAWVKDCSRRPFLEELRAS
ncbi:H-NS histone family protein [Fodinicurvata halophila]|uniref:H-NS histone family protein n=1 Tax=Fodinicurvata halophila TaxID=1419723 RepID=UPI003637C5E0